MKQITVAELIELLKKQPQDALVWSEGGYCYYPIEDVTFSKWKTGVVLF